MLGIDRVINLKMSPSSFEHLLAIFAPQLDLAYSHLFTLGVLPYVFKILQKKLTTWFKF